MEAVAQIVELAGNRYNRYSSESLILVLTIDVYGTAQ